MNKPVLVGALFALAVVVVLIYTSFGNHRFRCEVCVSYEGQSACRRASAASKDGALRSATENACAQIVSGMTATVACTSAPPVRVTWLR